ncbi:HEPN domain-containing protein [Salimicrobium sp. PL1-032A]|uniref:ApeA N-terminal domain 1-containing protein n=1 Tax=Salimicrobium sp. PL1-032A TaxID=3095364 RepID=UPI003261A964
MNRNVSLKKLTLQDEFEIQGYWWLPEEPSEKFSGTLYSGEDAIYLDILESFQDLQSAKNKEGYEIIHGVTVTGDEVTLFDSFRDNFTDNKPGLSYEKIFSNYLIVGDHFENQEDLQFKGLELYSNYLTKWFNKCPFSLNRNEETSETTTTYTPPDVTSYYIESIKAEIKNSYNFNFQPSPHASIFKYSEFIKLTPDVRKGFEWFQDKLSSFQKLVSLMIGERFNYEKIVFLGEDENLGTEEKPLIRPKRYHLFISLKEGEMNEKLHSHKMLFTFPMIEDQFEEICDNWFARKENLRNVYSLHFSDVFNTSLNPENKFLNAVQSLEVYHRAMGYGKEIDDQRKDEILTNVQGKLKESITDDELEVVLGKLRHMNECSLNKRLKDIMKESFDEETIQYLFNSNKKAKSFIRKVVQTRNYLTHYGEEGNEKRYEGVELHFAKELLKVVASIVLFKECGIKEGKVLERMKNTFDLPQRVSYSKKRLRIDQ